MAVLKIRQQVVNKLPNSNSALKQDELLCSGYFLRLNRFRITDHKIINDTRKNKKIEHDGEYPAYRWVA